jgi:hypothetical protein
MVTSKQCEYLDMMMAIRRADFPGSSFPTSGTNNQVGIESSDSQSVSTQHTVCEMHLRRTTW